MMAVATLHILKKGVFTDEQIEKLRGNNPLIEFVTEEEYASRVARANKEAFAPYRAELSRLTFDEKMDWYARRNSQEVVFLGHNPYFQRYWKWHVLMPIKVKRFFYRLKNGQLWKHYAHITDTPKYREKKRKAGPELI